MATRCDDLFPPKSFYRIGPGHLAFYNAFGEQERRTRYLRRSKMMNTKCHVGLSKLAVVGMVLLTCCALPTARAEETGPGIIGQWEGLAKQPGLQHDTYPVLILLKSEETGIVQYPTLNASGTIKLERKEKGTYVYRETITEGDLDRIINNGLMKISFQDEQTVKWVWSHEKSTVRATAELRRKYQSTRSISHRKLPSNPTPAQLTSEIEFLQDDIDDLQTRVLNLEDRSRPVYSDSQIMELIVKYHENKPDFDDHLKLLQDILALERASKALSAEKDAGKSSAKPEK